MNHEIWSRLVDGRLVQATCADIFRMNHESNACDGQNGISRWRRIRGHTQGKEREREKNVHDQNDGAGRRSISIWWKTFHSAGTYANQRHLRSADAWRWAAYWRAESLNPPASSGTRKYLKIIPSINIWFTLLLKWMNDEVMAQYHFKFTKPWIWTYQVAHKSLIKLRNDQFKLFMRQLRL